MEGRIEFALEVPEVPEVPVAAPSVLPKRFELPVLCKLVTDQGAVSVFRINVSNPHCMKILEEIRHPCILRPLSIIYGADESETHTVLVQPYKGNLLEYFEDLLLDDTKDLEDIITLVQIVFRQVIEGLNYLLDHDLYHGEFKLENTYYCMEERKPVIKLANFKGWELSATWDSEKLPSEWILVGKGLDEIVKLITTSRPESDLRCLCEMRDLAVELKTRRTTPDQKKELSLKHCFFWTPEKRGSVFTYNIPMFFKDKVFVDIVIADFICPADFLWDGESYFGLLRLMNDYRLSKSKLKYMGLKKTHYLKFVCGSYTHEKHFKVPLYKNVDAILRICDPELVLKVMKVVNAYKTAKKV